MTKQPADYLTRLQGLGVFQLVEREQHAVELLEAAEANRTAVDQRLAEGAAARLTSGDAAACERAVLAVRVADLRVRDAQQVLGTVRAALAAAREAAFGAEAVQRSKDEAPERRRELIAQLERAQFQHGQASAAFEGAGLGVWMTLHPPGNKPPTRKLTSLGERLAAARDQAQQEVDRIRAELRGLDELEQGA